MAVNNLYQILYFEKTQDNSVFLFNFGYPRNTFVLEYCGEVLDHKEFKTRVKEYARNKNIHYYFMSLKNNEVRGEAPVWFNYSVKVMGI